MCFEGMLRRTLSRTAIGRSVTFLVLALGFLVGPRVLALDVSPELCAVLLLRGANRNQIERHFAPSEGHSYRDLEPELREKLIRSAWAMAVREDPSEGFVFAAGDHGGAGLANLWLLGVPASEIKEVVHPLLDRYYDSRIAPGHRVLSQGRSLMSPPEESVGLPEVGRSPRTVVSQGRFVSGNRGLAEAFLQDLSRSKIDSDFAETNSLTVAQNVDLAMLADYPALAYRLIDYLELLSPTSAEYVLTVARYRSQGALFALSNRLALSVLATVGNPPPDFFTARPGALWAVRKSLPTEHLAIAAIEGLGRIVSPDLKSQANKLLIALGAAFSEPGFLRRFPANGPQADLLKIAFKALESTGDLLKAHYQDSAKVVLTFGGIRDPLTLKLIMRAVIYFSQYQNETHRSYFAELISVLRAAEQWETLKSFGHKMLQRRDRTGKSEHRLNIYFTAFDLFEAGGDLVSAREALRWLIGEYKVGRFDRGNAVFVDEYRVRSLMQAAAVVNDKNFLGELCEVAHGLNWYSVEEEGAILLLGWDKNAASALFPHNPSIPREITDVLATDRRYREALKQIRLYQPGERNVPPVPERIENVFVLKDLIGPYFEARAAESLIALGDKLMEQYAKSSIPERRLVVGYFAHDAYFRAAVILQERRDLLRAGRRSYE